MTEPKYTPEEAYLRLADFEDWDYEKRMAAVSWLHAWARARNRNQEYNKIKAETAIVQFDRWWTRNHERVWDLVDERIEFEPDIPVVFDGVDILVGDPATDDEVTVGFKSFMEVDVFVENIHGTEWYPDVPAVYDPGPDSNLVLDVVRRT